MNTKTPEQIQEMFEGGQILKQIIDQLIPSVQAGTTTADIDKLARELLLSHNVKPAFLGYGGFPAAICISVNDQVVHGVPSERILKQGDIVGLDFGLIHKGWNLDSAVTVPVRGDISDELWRAQYPIAHKLIEITRESLYAGIKQAHIGNTVGDIGAAVQSVVEAAGFGVVRDLVGHGIGKRLHEEPHVPNVGKSGTGPRLIEGMVIAIEPITTAGQYHVALARDGFTYTTRDHSLSAHFEHTVAITADGPRILTK